MKSPAIRAEHIETRIFFTVFEAIRQLIEPPAEPRPRIGFR
jgi:hypothetical protein